MPSVYCSVVAALSDYERTAGAVHSLGYHIVWCPKYRKPLLVGPVAERLRALLEDKAVEQGWSIEALELMPDHVHVFVRCPPKASPSYIANQFKGFTSRVLRSEFPHLRSRLPTMWSRSFFVATVGRVSEDTIRRYIDEQTTRPTKGRP
jgi:putative transposase